MKQVLGDYGFRPTSTQSTFTCIHLPQDSQTTNTKAAETTGIMLFTKLNRRVEWCVQALRENSRAGLLIYFLPAQCSYTIQVPLSFFFLKGCHSGFFSCLMVVCQESVSLCACVVLHMYSHIHHDGIGYVQIRCSQLPNLSS